MAFMPIRRLQQALTQARERGANISSPGAIDGRWGPQTERSLDAYLSALTPPYHGEVQVEVLEGPGAASAEPGIMILRNDIMTGLNRLADEYAARGAQAAAGLGPALSSGQPNTMVWVGAGLMAIVLIGGSVWWFSRKARR